MMPSDKHNSGYWLDFFTDPCCFVLRCAFSPTAAALMLSWFYQSFSISSPLLCMWRFAVVLLYGFMEDLVTAVIAEVFLILTFAWNIL